MAQYVSSYCNKAHRVSDGKPIEHECVVIPPAALRAEQAGEYDRAIEIMGARPLKTMRRGVRQNQRCRNAKDYSDKLDLDEVAKLFGLPTQGDIDEDIMRSTDDVFGYAYKEALRERERDLEEGEELGPEDEEAAEEAARKVEEREQADMFRNYMRAIESVAEHFFELHHLNVTEDVDNPGTYVVEAKSWEKAADEIRETINGVGMFEFSDLQEFLDSGPYTAKEAVLSHLHWMKDYAEVYGEASPQRLFEKAMR